MTAVGMHHSPVWGSYLAGADLSSDQYKFVKFLNSAANTVVLYDGSGDILGVLMNQPASGQTADVAQFGGGAKLKVGAGIAGGNQVKVESTGLGALAEFPGDKVFAIADAIGRTTASGDIIPVFLVRPANTTGSGDNSHQLKKIAVATYDFPVDGGAQGDIDMGVDLPDNAIITEIRTEEIDALTSGGSATVTFKAGATALTGALAFDSDFTGIDVHALASADGVKTVAESNLNWTIGTADLTAGKVVAYVEYVISPED